MALILHAGDAVSVPIADLIYPSSNLKILYLRRD
jgi:hypothetical protein